MTVNADLIAEAREAVTYLDAFDAHRLMGDGEKPKIPERLLRATIQGTMARLADALEAATKDAEWEYGVHVPALGGEPEWSATLESARSVQNGATTTYKKWTHLNPVEVVRRHPAGPWLVVPSVVTGKTEDAK